MSTKPSAPLRGSILRELAPMMSLGVELAAAVLLGGGAGWLVDNATGMSPVWTVVGFVFGVAAAIVQFSRAVRRLGQRSSSAPHKPTT